jgi:hypothetical protein
LKMSWKFVDNQDRLPVGDPTYCGNCLRKDYLQGAPHYGSRSAWYTAVCRTKARTPFLSERSISTSTVPPNITLKYAFTNNFITINLEYKVRGLNFKFNIKL